VIFSDTLAAAANHYITASCIYRKSCLHSKTYQMHASLGGRFKDVREIFIYSFAQLSEIEEEWEDYWETLPVCKVDIDVAMRAVPFITTFRNLEKICFGGCGVDDDILYPIVPYHEFFKYHLRDRNSQKALLRLIEAMAYGYQCGALSPSLVVKGLHCPRKREGDRGCEECTRACRSFPVEAVAEFHFNDSHWIGSKKKLFCNRVCLGRNRVVSFR
jgi:hypothetical protein